MKKALKKPGAFGMMAEATAPEYPSMPILVNIVFDYGTIQE
jgi:hypothetical protein